ncbi:MAG: GYD domain protein [Verrucomicrobia bacterium]|nr:MAG: GYD domain protein [Verrucomicrobiota bacterium]
MPKYLIRGSYSDQGLKGLLEEGGSKRREAAEQSIQGLGGRLEAFYYAFGNDDFVIIADLPSNVDASALSLTANLSGALKSHMTVLITPEEVDQATKRTVKFRPPGK